MVIGTITYFNCKEEVENARGLHIYHSNEDVINLSEFDKFEKKSKPTPKIGILNKLNLVHKFHGGIMKPKINSV